MSEQAKLIIDNKEYTYPIITGSEGERAFDATTLRKDTGCITYDDGYGNTGSCLSDVTFIDGEKGILRHRGYPIEELAQHSSFLETAYLIIYGELPTAEDFVKFRGRIHSNANIHEGMKNTFQAFPPGAHPMAVLSAMMNTVGCYYPELATNNRERDVETFDWAAALLLSKVRSIAALTYRHLKGKPWTYSRPNYRYSENFLHMMFSDPYNDYVPRSEVADALDLIFLLHADHEQNCSTSTVRMVASSGANLFASVAAGVCALWGPLHGGANMAVIRMLEDIHRTGDDGSRFIEDAKNGKQRLMGFGHRVYRNFDPRSRILGKAAERIFDSIGIHDPLLDIARHLEEAALKDDYFISRKLYPNVDFYSGIILRAIGIPVEFFTVMFSIGRMPGWIANWHEIAKQPKQKIHRPRQIYMGRQQRSYIPMELREETSESA